MRNIPQRHWKRILGVLLSATLAAAGLLAYKWQRYRSCMALLERSKAGADRLKELNERGELQSESLKEAISNIEAQIDYCDYYLPRWYASWRVWFFRRVKALLKSIGQDIEAVQSGNDPYRNKKGTFLKCYTSKIDGGREPYSLYVPDSYNPDQAMPLIVNLHGHQNWRTPYQCHLSPRVDGCIVLSPHGKGSIDYKWVAEEEVLRAIEIVKKDYNIDPDRVYLMGHSMGGTGCWSLAVHYPHLFAALSPGSGNTDHTVWEELWERPDDASGPQRMEDLRSFLKAADSSVTYAGNLLNVPSFCVHGWWDSIVPVEHSRRMVDNLRRTGCSVVYKESRLIGHTLIIGARKSERIKWLKSQRRNPWPEHAKVKASRLKYARAYWIRINRFDHLLQFAEINAHKVSDSSIEVIAQNVSSFTIQLDPKLIPSDPKELVIKVNDAVAFMGDAKHKDSITLGDSQGHWAEQRKAGGGDRIVKRPGLEGPIEDAFTSRFIAVYGTSASTDFERLIVRREAEGLQRLWDQRFRYPCYLKADTDITDDDIETANLILYGSPKANKVTARIIDKLPIRFDDNNIYVAAPKGRATGQMQFAGDDVGVKLCYPNPLSPTKYVVIMAGVTWRGMFQINTRFGNWFNWSAYENRGYFDYGIFDSKTRSPETFLTFGYFDQDWRLRDEYQFVGDQEKRAAVSRCRLPTNLCGPAGLPPDELPQVYLSDCLPEVIDQTKGAVSFDFSYNGNALRIGTKTYTKGFGVRAPSRITFNLAAKFKRFTADVGIDHEGIQSISRPRKKNNIVIFEVYGDGELLYESAELSWSDAPESIDVSVENIEELELKVKPATRYSWHVGSATWGGAKVR